MFSLNVGDSSFTNIYNFTNGVDGSTSLGALAISGGTLYGTTSAGGTNFPGWGTIFKLNTDGTGFANLYEFAQGPGGTQPAAALLLSGSTLYGTTPHTSGAGGGTVFKLGTDGSSFTVIANGSDGAQPQGGLVLSADSFYGTTSAGGAAGAGTVFRVSTNGIGFTTLHTFPAANTTPAPEAIITPIPMAPFPWEPSPHPAACSMGLPRAAGVSAWEQSLDSTPTGRASRIFTTSPTDSMAEHPRRGWSSGNTLYGTALPTGGATGGTVFKLNTDGSGYIHLHDFSVLAFSTNTDGNDPVSGLVLGGDTLYGTTIYGGPGGEGTIFKINTNGLGFTNIYSFNVGSFTNIFDAVDPMGGLTLSGNTLYGTTFSSITVAHSKGGGGPGTVFKVNTDGTGFVNLHPLTNSFDGTGQRERWRCRAANCMGRHRKAAVAVGLVFQLDTNGTSFTTLHSFGSQVGTPIGDLLAIGNTVYGTCEFGAPRFRQVRASVRSSP